MAAAAGLETDEGAVAVRSPVRKGGRGEGGGVSIELLVRGKWG
jgi:hypothetical protein